MATAEGSIASAGERDEDKEAFDYHMGGPVGALTMTLVLPLLTIYLWICVHRFDGSLVWPSRELLAAFPWPTLRAAAYFAAWLVFQIALDLFLPGKTVEGLKQRDGVVLTYRLNGLTSLWVSMAAMAALLYSGVVTGKDVLAELGALLTISVIFAYLLGFFLYFYGFSSKRDERRSGNLIYDYFMGTALNPRIGRFDLKFFFESKIGLTTWVAIVMAMCAVELEQSGTISLPMLLVAIFQIFYVADFYWFEDAMLSTWDINYENYGFMLAMGFVIWMPFNFSLQSQYLVYHDPALPLWAVPLLVIFNFAGYYIFRSSNLQKHRFRRDPDTLIWGKKPEFIATKRGTKLLTSGWWGVARHSNYLGDLMMALAWCLPCLFSHITPYFYFIYFAPLLIDRERRDHKECQKKYGSDWDTYCKKVRYRIVPGLY